MIGLAEIIIAKHRNGATGDVRLRFKSEYAKFMNIEDDMPVREFSSAGNKAGSAGDNAYGGGTAAPGGDPFGSLSSAPGGDFNLPQGNPNEVPF